MTAEVCYKLVSATRTTRNDTRWTPKKWNPAGVRDGKDGLCSASWYHAYPRLDDLGPYLAAIRDCQDANIGRGARLWRAEARGILHQGNGLKLGATEMRLVEEVALPMLTAEDRAAIAIMIAGEVVRDATDERLSVTWMEWQQRWLAGERLAANAAAANAAAAADAAYAAANAAAAAAVSAANAAETHLILRAAFLNYLAWKGGAFQ
jgi:hypothetical protein